MGDTLSQYHSGLPSSSKQSEVRLGGISDASLWRNILCRRKYMHVVESGPRMQGQSALTVPESVPTSRRRGLCRQGDVCELRHLYFFSNGNIPAVLF